MNRIVKKNILFKLSNENTFSNEIILAEHTLFYIISGKLKLYKPEGELLFEAGDIVLSHRNQLIKSEHSIEENGKPFKSIVVILTQQTLRAFAMENAISKATVYSGQKNLKLGYNDVITSFFESLKPYYSNPDLMTNEMADVKTNEAIVLLSQSSPQIHSFLFDFSIPYKIDLAEFMNRNYMFNVSMTEFATLSGRSLSTFKRDFAKSFNNTPERWLKERRLEEAHYLIQEKHIKPSDVYHQVGFENFSHFSNAFKQKFGYNASDLLHGKIKK